MKLSQGRALIASSPFDLIRRCGTDHDKGLEIMERARSGALRRAGIAGAERHVNGRSADAAASSPVMVPWAIYPLDPADCAALICDLIMFETVISVASIVQSLEARGLAVQMLLAGEGDELRPDQDLMRVASGSRLMTVHSPSLTPLLFELLEPETWANGIAEVLAMPDLPGAPVLIFADEQQTRLPPAG